MIPLSRPHITDAERRAVLEVLDSGNLTMGPRVAAFEEAFARATGASWAVATSSGTTALHVALLAHGVGPGDEVVTTPFTFVATVNAILYTGATPVFVDVDEATMNLDASLLERALTPRTKAILPVHLFGLPCDLDAIEALATPRGIAVIEDAAQALGATLGGAPIGARGTACFSLYATKNITSGEGGMIVGRDPKILERARLLRRHGMRARNAHEILGFNFRMSDLHAAIGLAQLGRLDEMIARRRENAAVYGDRLGGLAGLTLPRDRRGATHAWHQYTVRFAGGARDAAAKALHESGVATGVYYPKPLTEQPHVRARLAAVNASPEVPVAARLSREVLSIPVHPLLTTDEREHVADAVRRFASR